MAPTARRPTEAVAPLLRPAGSRAWGQQPFRPPFSRRRCSSRPCRPGRDRSDPRALQAPSLAPEAARFVARTGRPQGAAMPRVARESSSIKDHRVELQLCHSRVQRLRSARSVARLWHTRRLHSASDERCRTRASASGWKGTYSDDRGPNSWPTFHYGSCSVERWSVAR